MIDKKKNTGAVIVTYNPNISILEVLVSKIRDQFDCFVIINNGADLIFFENTYSLGDNFGIAYAQNFGIDLIRKNNPDLGYVTLFDQDSIPSDNFRKELQLSVNYLNEKNIKYSAVGGVYFNPDDGSFAKIPKIKMGFNFGANFVNSNLVEVSYLIASGCMINLAAYDLIGGMDEALFIDYVDVEWSMRSKNMGYPTFCTNKAKMLHHLGDKRKKIMGKTIPVYSPIRRYYQVRNFFKIFRMKHMPLSYKLREAWIQFFLRIPFSMIFTNDLKMTLKMTLKGILDGFFMKFGKIGNRYDQ